MNLFCLFRLEEPALTSRGRTHEFNFVVNESEKGPLYQTIITVHKTYKKIVAAYSSYTNSHRKLFGESILVQSHYTLLLPPTVEDFYSCQIPFDMLFEKCIKEVDEQLQFTSKCKVNDDRDDDDEIDEEEEDNRANNDHDSFGQVLESLKRQLVIIADSFNNDLHQLEIHAIVASFKDSSGNPILDLMTKTFCKADSMEIQTRARSLREFLSFFKRGFYVATYFKVCNNLNFLIITILI